MHRSARTAHTIRPSASGSSTMHPDTGHAAWQIEHANAPKQRSGSITAIVLGAFLRGPPIILVHIVKRLYPTVALVPSALKFTISNVKIVDFRGHFNGAP